MYCVYAKRTRLDMYQDYYLVGYDNNETSDLDNAMQFKTKEEAECWIKSSEAKQWTDCSFDIEEITD